MKECLNKQINSYLSSCEKTNRPPFVFLEVGSYIGTSFILFSKILERRLKNNHLMISVDPFTNNVPVEEKEWGVKFMGSSVNKIYFYFLYNLSMRPNFNNFLHIRRKSIDSLDILKKFAPLDFVYLDGSHYLQAVYEDIKNFKKIIANEKHYKGILSGDDCELTYQDIINLDPSIKNEKDFENLMEKFSQTDQIEFKGKNFHPGVTGALHLFAKENKVKLNLSNGFWSMSQN